MVITLPRDEGLKIVKELTVTMANMNIIQDVAINQIEQSENVCFNFFAVVSNAAA